MQRAIRAAGFAAVALLSSCQSFSNRTGTDKLDYSNVSSEKAVIILSTGISQLCPLVATPGAWDVSLYPVTASYTWGGIAGFMVSNRMIKSDFADHQGNIHAITLEPGSYYLAPKMEGSLGLTTARRYAFTVASGEVVYLGEFWLFDKCEDGVRTVVPTGVLVTNTVYSRIRDQQQRDMDLLAEKNPALARANIIKRLAEPAGFAAGGE